MDAPDFAGPLLGWRVWLTSVEAGRWRLASVVHKCVWPTGAELVADCLTTAGRGVHDHVAPREMCRCGIYGARDTETLLTYIGYPYMPDMRLRAVGLVELWGKVVQHEVGWRASHAYPLAIWLPVVTRGGDPPGEWEQVAADLTDYGRPVEVVECADAETLLARALSSWESGGLSGEAV